MSTRISKPVTRVIDIGGYPWNVTLNASSITFRAFRSPRRSEIILPLSAALQQAAWLAGAPKRKPKFKRSVL